MCVAAKGRLQGRAATLLLLWAGFSIFFFVLMQQKFHCHCVVVVSFLRLVANVLAVCYVCVPRPLGGDGVVFADPAHDRTIF